MCNLAIYLNSQLIMLNVILEYVEMVGDLLICAKWTEAMMVGDKQGLIFYFKKNVLG